jgi:hypothetical protein
MVTEVTSLRRSDDGIEARVSQMLLDYEVARRRAPIVLSYGHDANGKPDLKVERGHDKLREALKQRRPIKADIVPRFAAAPVQRQAG